MISSLDLNQKVLFQTQNKKFKSPIISRISNRQIFWLWKSRSSRRLKAIYN